MPSLKRQARQRGGATIVIALLLLVVLSVAAFGVARGAIRDLSQAGTLTQGTKAEEAAEAGLDWFIIWSHPDNAAQATSSEGNKALVNGISAVKAPGWTQTDTAHFEVWDRAFRVVSTPDQTSDMVFSRKDGLVKQTAAKGNQVTQKFDVTVRFLGFVASSMTAGGGQASGGTTPAALSTQDLLWQVVSEGSANIPTSSTTHLQFRQRRETIGIQSLGQSQASNPTAAP